MVFKYLFFTMLGLCWHGGFSLVVVSRGSFLVVVHAFLIAVASCCKAWTLGHMGFSSCGMWAL